MKYSTTLLDVANIEGCFEDFYFRGSLLFHVYLCWRFCVAYPPNSLAHLPPI
jgi:hypothetical protein